MKPLIFLTVFLLSVASAHAAVISGRETSATVRPKTGMDGEKRVLKGFAHERIVNLTFTLSGAEWEGETYVEVAYFRMDDPARPELQRAKARIRKGFKSMGLSLSFIGDEKMKDAWGARLIVDGVAVAWAGENAEAIALINPPAFKL